MTDEYGQEAKEKDWFDGSMLDENPSTKAVWSFAT